MHVKWQLQPIQFDEVMFIVFSPTGNFRHMHFCANFALFCIFLAWKHLLTAWGEIENARIVNIYNINCLIASWKFKTSVY